MRALEAGVLPATEVGGVLLDGVEVRDCPTFDTWLLLARERALARSREALRREALERLTAGDSEAAVTVAHRAACLDPLDEAAQELLLRALVAAGHEAQATVHLQACEATFAREGLRTSPALRAAARGRVTAAPSGVRAAVVARSLLEAGGAALAAGAADAGVETLRRAVEEAGHAHDAELGAETLGALGAALVHAVRGLDGEGAVVLHRALAAARSTDRADLVAEVLRELGFVDVQAGRHGSAARSLHEAARIADGLGDRLLTARVLAVQGMNEADLGRHTVAADLLRESVRCAAAAGSGRQQAWSLGVLARSLLLSGDVAAARRAAEDSIVLTQQERWQAFLPWPQVLRSQLSAEAGDWAGARDDAESAFALACELRDPCWEGMAGRALALVAAHTGDRGAARTWTAEARDRCDRVSDRYVWVSGYIGLADVELADAAGGTRAAAAARLRRDAARSDLPEFLAWALVHQAELGDRSLVPHAVRSAVGIDSAALRDRVAALSG